MMNEKQLLEEEGKGAQGQVYQVFKEGKGVVAAKVIPENDFSQIEWQAGLKLAREQQNPFVLKHISASQTKDFAIILMEYANLKSLDILIKSPVQLQLPTIRAMMKQILEGLRIIHESGFIHRDIKGQNILMHSPPGSGRVILKIADFGLVKVLSKEMQIIQMSTKGTLPNMAPELIIGDGQADSKVDIWSAGIVLFQLIAKEYPINAKSIFDLEKKMLLKRIDRPEIIKDDLMWDLIINLLQFDPKNRFTASEALQHPFFTNVLAHIQITDEIRELTSQAEQYKISGDSSITKYDIQQSYTIPSQEIKNIVQFDPDIEYHQIQSQILLSTLTRKQMAEFYQNQQQATSGINTFQNNPITMQMPINFNIQQSQNQYNQYQQQLQFQQQQIQQQQFQIQQYQQQEQLRNQITFQNQNPQIIHLGYSEHITKTYQESLVKPNNILDTDQTISYQDMLGYYSSQTTEVIFDLLKNSIEKDQLISSSQQQQQQIYQQLPDQELKQEQSQQLQEDGIIQLNQKESLIQIQQQQDEIKNKLFIHNEINKKITIDMCNLLIQAIQAISYKQNKQIGNMEDNGKEIIQTSKEIQKLIIQIIKNSIFEEQDIEIILQSQLAKEIINYLYKMQPYDISIELISIIETICEKSNSNQTHKLYELETIQSISTKLKNNNKQIQYNILKSMRIIIKNGWQQIKLQQQLHQQQQQQNQSFSQIHSKSKSQSESPIPPKLSDSDDFNPQLSFVQNIPLHSQQSNQNSQSQSSQSSQSQSKSEQISNQLYNQQQQQQQQIQQQNSTSVNSNSNCQSFNRIHHPYLDALEKQGVIRSIAEDILAKYDVDKDNKNEACKVLDALYIQPSDIFNQNDGQQQQKKEKDIKKDGFNVSFQNSLINQHEKPKFSFNDFLQKQQQKKLQNQEKQEEEQQKKELEQEKEQEQNKKEKCEQEQEIEQEQLKEQKQSKEQDLEKEQEQDQVKQQEQLKQEQQKEQEQEKQQKSEQQLCNQIEIINDKLEKNIYVSENQKKKDKHKHKEKDNSKENSKDKQKEKKKMKLIESELLKDDEIENIKKSDKLNQQEKDKFQQKKNENKKGNNSLSPMQYQLSNNQSKPPIIQLALHSSSNPIKQSQQSQPSQQKQHSSSSSQQKLYSQSSNQIQSQQSQNQNQSSSSHKQKNQQSLQSMTNIVNNNFSQNIINNNTSCDDEVFIICDGCHQPVRFTEYTDHYNKHLQRLQNPLINIEKEKDKQKMKGQEKQTKKEEEKDYGILNQKLKENQKEKKKEQVNELKIKNEQKQQVIQIIPCKICRLMIPFNEYNQHMKVHQNKDENKNPYRIIRQAPVKESHWENLNISQDIQIPLQELKQLDQLYELIDKNDDDNETQQQQSVPAFAQTKSSNQFISQTFQTNPSDQQTQTIIHSSPSLSTSSETKSKQKKYSQTQQEKQSHFPPFKTFTSTTSNPKAPIPPAPLIHSKIDEQFNQINVYCQQCNQLIPQELNAEHIEQHKQEKLKQDEIERLKEGWLILQVVKSKKNKNDGENENKNEKMNWSLNSNDKKQKELSEKGKDENIIFISSQKEDEQRQDSEIQSEKMKSSKELDIKLSKNELTKEKDKKQSKQNIDNNDI